MSEINTAIATFGSTAEVICALDSEANFRSVSLGAQNIWGFAPRELLGAWFGSLIAPEDARTALRSLKEVLHGKEVPPFEAAVVCRNGQQLTMLWSMTCTDKHVVCIAHDITERKRTELLLRVSEARSRLIVESLPIGLVITDEQCRIELANPAAEAMFGLDIKSLIGKNLNSLFRPAASATAAGNLIAKLPREKPIELDCEKLDGSVFPIEITINEFAGLSAINLIITLLDVSERRQIEKLKRELLSMIRHDLGGPLTAVQGVLCMLEENFFGELAPEGTEAVSMASGQIRNVIQLMDGLVGVTKIGGATNQLNPEPAPITTLLLKGLEQCVNSAEDKRIAFVLPKINPLLYVDLKQVQQVFGTLLSSLCERSNDSATLQIVVTPQAERVLIKITSSDVIARQTDDLKRQNKDHSIAHHKSDLDMAVCKSIIERHAGKFEIKGTDQEAFEFSLPLARSEASAP